MVGKDFNPTTYNGGRVSALYQVDDDWDVLIAESLENLETDGLSVEYPTGSDFQPLQPLQITSFTPSYNKDRYSNTAWTVNGKIADLKVVYTGGYTDRHIKEQMGLYELFALRRRHVLPVRRRQHRLGCRGSELLFADRLLAGHDRQHASEQRIPRQHARRLAPARHRRRVLGTVPHLRRHELQL